MLCLPANSHCPHPPPHPFVHPHRPQPLLSDEIYDLRKPIRPVSIKMYLQTQFCCSSVCLRSEPPKRRPPTPPSGSIELGCMCPRTPAYAITERYRILSPKILMRVMREAGRDRQKSAATFSGERNFLIGKEPKLHGNGSAQS